MRRGTERLIQIALVELIILMGAGLIGGIFLVVAVLHALSGAGDPTPPYIEPSY